MKKIFVVLVLLAVLLASLILVEDRHELRRMANGGEVDVMFLPDSKEVKTGERFGSVLVVDTKEVNFVGMDVLIKFDGGRLRVVEVEEGNDGVSEYFGGDVLVDSLVDQDAGTILLTCATAEVDVNKMPKGVLSLFKIVFEANGEGETEVGLDDDYEHVFVGQRSTDVQVLSLGKSEKAVYKVERSVVAVEQLEEWPVLNFWVSFSGLKTEAGDCAKDWKLRLTVLGGGETKVYENVGLVRDGVKVVDVGGHDVELARYKGSVRLIDFVGHDDGVAVFLKGPMHMQTKYGMDGQTGWYEKEGGEISLTLDFETSPTYDFAGYPLLAGDVVGDLDDVPNGVLNTRDFSYVKSKINISKESLSKGEMIMGDFDGDCWVGNVDLITLMLSLKEEQSQLY